MIAVGIDIAKAGYDVAIHHDDQPKPTHQRHPTPEAAAAMIAAHVPPDTPAIITMEYTGGLALPLLTILEQEPRYQLMIANDTDTAALRHLLRSHRKSDKLDAILISRLSALARDTASADVITNHLTPWPHLAPNVHARVAVRHYQALTRDRTRAKLRLGRATSDLQRRHLTATIAHLTTQRAEAEAALLAALPPEAVILTTIPGITPRRAAVIAATIGDTRHFPTPDKAVRFCGLVPPHRPSSNNKPSGPPLRPRQSDLLATELHMWSLSTIARTTSPIPGWAATYQRYKAADRARTGLRTCQRKLIRTAWHMLRTQQPFDPDRTRDPRHQLKEPTP